MNGYKKDYHLEKRFFLHRDLREMLRWCAEAYSDRIAFITKLKGKALARIPEEDLTRFIGYGTLNTAVNPKYGPGTNYASYSDRTMGRGTQVAVISAENGYYQVECYYNNSVFRSWIPTGNIDLS